MITLGVLAILLGALCRVEDGKTAGESDGTMRSDWNPCTQGLRGEPREGQKVEAVKRSAKGVWQLDTRLVPNREEMGRILGIAKDYSARTYVFLAICSHLGFRLCEVAHIKSDDVGERKVVVTRRKKRYLQPTVVDVPDSLWPTLSEWASSHEGYLFPGNAAPCVIRRSKAGVRLPDELACDGGHLSLRVIQRDWALIVAEAGLRKRGRGIHQTRHYFGTEFYNATKDIRATQEALAHSNMEMTARYAHVVDMKEKVNKVPGLL